MGLIHTTSNSGKITASECVTHVKHTLLLSDDKLGTHVVLGRNVAFNRVKSLHIGVAECLDAETLGHTLTRLTTLVVGRIDKLVLNHRVDKHQLVAVDAEGEVFKLERAAVETYQTVLLAEYRCKLVHNAAVHTAIVVLGRLADFGQFKLLDSVAVKKVIHRKSKARLKGGR